MHTVDTLTISFPELDLPARAAHHLRGYLGELFREHSPLLHNHYTDGTLRYAYPLVQYKVLNGVPTLVGVGEGARLLPELFLRVHELELDGRRYALRDKRLESVAASAGVGEDLLAYRFETLWMALNQANHREYVGLDVDDPARAAFLDRLLRNHLLAMFKGLGVWLALDERVFAKAKLEERATNFKDQQMLAFAGEFVTNAVIPAGLGIGKAVSRGFGTVALQRGEVRTADVHKRPARGFSKPGANHH